MAHTAITDHRILRDPQVEDRSPPRTGLSPDDVPLVPFYPESEGYPTLDRQRDLGIALMQLARVQPRAQVSLGKAALSLLEAAVEAWPDDLVAHEARACALWSQGRNQDALAAYEALLAKAPRREQALLDVAAICEQLNDEERALGFGRRLLDVNPWGAGTHYQVAKLLAQRRRARVVGKPVAHVGKRGGQDGRGKLQEPCALFGCEGIGVARSHANDAKGR